MNVVFPRLYAIIDRSLLQKSAMEVAGDLIAAGVGLIQYRDKEISAAGLFNVVQQLVARFEGSAARLIVNDRPDVAAMARAGGVHVGQTDLSPEDAREIVGPSCWVGISTHNLAQLQAAAAGTADYIVVGPVFATRTKADPDPVVGVELIRVARSLTRKPIVAIGGITLDRAGDVFRAGADSVAVARDLLCAADPAARAVEYQRLAVRIFGAKDAQRSEDGSSPREQ
jgi:thiamine-phosphate pyrophosphorylase